MSNSYVTVRSEKMTLSQLIWQKFGRQPIGYLEQVLNANPDLAEKGLFIPVGTKVLFPLVVDEVTSVERQNVVRLWD